MTPPRCPPNRACMTCNPKPRAMYLEPKPVVDRIACKNCQRLIAITEMSEHLEQCQPQGGIP